MWTDHYVPPTPLLAVRPMRLSSAARAEPDWEEFRRDLSEPLWRALGQRGMARSTFFLALVGLDDDALRRKCRAARGLEPTDPDFEAFQQMVDGATPFGLKRRRVLLAALDRGDLLEPPALLEVRAPISTRDILLAGASLRRAPVDFPTAGSKVAVDLEAARALAAKALAKVVMEARLPFAGIVAGSLQPEVMALKLASGMRLSTLLGRLSEHRRMARWLLPTFGCCFPSMPVELLDYLLARSLEPCGPSVPGSIVYMVGFFERIGSVPDCEQVASHGLVQGLVADLTLSLRSDTPVTTKKAPQFFSCMLVAWEITVANVKELVYTRLAAWCKLLKIWTSMRTSDAESCPPSNMFWHPTGLSGRIDQSKTTGAGKRVGAIHFHISSGAWLCVEGWLEIGWRLFEPSWGTRKCLLPLPLKGTLELSERSPSYAQACDASQKLVADCRIIVEDPITKAAEFGDRPLFLRVFEFLDGPFRAADAGELGRHPGALQGSHRHFGPLVPDGVG
ncbi:unnamed protein product [Polarella glacialis]|uniref:Uncharacterized protein n=1 Tax=Polarella glacialis TaxID=89957 RepID=A0A813I828_POLGL|nr:unnamed protein product [Polarella glacialis]